jgi:hypothetical protein
MSPGLSFELMSLIFWLIAVVFVAPLWLLSYALLNKAPGWVPGEDWL